MLKFHFSSTRWCWTLLVLLGAAGCTTETVEQESSSSTKSSQQTKKRAGQKPAIKVPQNAYANVEAALETAVTAKEEGNVKVLIRAETWMKQQGAKIIPALTAILDDQNAEVPRRTTACRALASLGTAARAPVLKATSSEERRLRFTAIERISLIKPADEPTVQRLIELLEDPDEQCQQIVIQSLKRIGSPARSAVPKLEEFANESTNEIMRGEAVKALKAIEPRTTLSNLRDSEP